MSADSDDLLERLLKEAGSSSTPSALREAAADGAHVDEATFEKLEKGEIDGDEARALRRHILFCDDCRDRAVEKSSDLPAPKTAKTKASKSSTAVPLSEETRHRTGLAVGLFVLVLAAVSGYLVVKATSGDSKSENDDLMPAPSFLNLRSIGDSGEGQRGVVHIGEPVYLDLKEDFGSVEQFVYVLYLDAQGHLSLLEPRTVPAKAMPIRGQMRLPREEPGWNIARQYPPRVGDELIFIILFSAERIAAFEGDIARSTTLPALEKELANAIPLSTENSLGKLCARVRAFGFGGIVRGIATTLRP